MPNSTLISRFRTMRGGRCVAVLILLLFSLELGFARNDHAATVITFDVPGAGTGTSQGTFPTSIDVSGRIAGYYVDANFAGHGFLRARDGTITTFDPPGSLSIDVNSINAAGTITGEFLVIEGRSEVYRGFVRAPDGTITTFDPPGSGSTRAFSINSAGAIAGFYSDASSVTHGFVRAPSGKFTTFDVPGLLDDVTSINDFGVVTGSYYHDTDWRYHSFVRAPNGTVTTFDAPGAGPFLAQGTFAESINLLGVVTGFYYDASYVMHGYVRTRDGVVTTIDPPGSSESDARSINLMGVVAGSYNDTRGHGYVRTPDGTFTTIDIPVTATGGYKGAASASDINLWCMVTGYYSDPNFGIHGYVWIPKYPCEKNDDHWKRRP
jgi:hypothetical protein